MTVPSIKNFETRPPAGGWSLDYTLNGQKWHFTGGWRQVTRQIANVQRANNQYTGMDAIFDFTNGVWCSRSPERCMSPAERSVVQKRVGCATCGGGRHR